MYGGIVSADDDTASRPLLEPLQNRGRSSWTLGRVTRYAGAASIGALVVAAAIEAHLRLRRVNLSANAIGCEGCRARVAAGRSVAEAEAEQGRATRAAGGGARGESVQMSSDEGECGQYTYPSGGRKKKERKIVI